MKTTPAILALLSLATAFPAAGAETGTGTGGQLVQEYCTGCHDDSVYTRADRRVTTYNGLENQVRRCETNLALKWFEDDILDVTHYLNREYYKFERPQ